MSTPAPDDSSTLATLRARVRELEEVLAAERTRNSRERGTRESAELELERAHHLLDTWGLPREMRDEEHSGRPMELSLSGRLELLEDDSLEEEGD